MADYTNLKEKIERGEWAFDLAHGDYHNHTWYSDGTKSPAGVIEHAQGLGLHEIGDAVEGLLHDNVRFFIFQQRFCDHAHIDAERAHHARFGVFVLDERIQPRADVLRFFLQTFL